jgi:hypothetical protein
MLQQMLWRWSVAVSTMYIGPVQESDTDHSRQLTADIESIRQRLSSGDFVNSAEDVSRVCSLERAADVVCVSNTTPRCGAGARIACADVAAAG